MRDRLSFLATSLTLLALHSPSVRSQELDIAAPGPSRLTFDVISIRPAGTPGPATFCNSQPSPGGNGYQVRCMNVKSMIAFMYKIPENQIAGIPAGLADTKFDIDAKAEKVYSISELHTMFQNMLVDRFGLTFHTEKRTGNVYALTIDGSGLKMTPNNGPEDMQPQFSGRPAALIGTRVSMNRLCWQLALLSRSDERPVVDMTGLTGHYDFKLDYLPELSPGVDKASLPAEYLDRPDLFTAIREQLGLRLTPRKGPVTFMVVDHVEKPSEN